MRLWRLRWPNSDHCQFPRKRGQGSTQNHLGIGIPLSRVSVSLTYLTHGCSGTTSTRITLITSSGIVTGAHNRLCMPRVSWLTILGRLSIEFPEVVATTKADVSCTTSVLEPTGTAHHSIGRPSDSSRDRVWSVSSPYGHSCTHKRRTQGPETRYSLCWR